MVIHTKEDFEAFYPYKGQIDQYPKEYPCVAKVEFEGGGLMGDYKQVYVAYFPKDVTIEGAFLTGLRNPWEILK